MRWIEHDRTVEGPVTLRSSLDIASNDPREQTAPRPSSGGERDLPPFGLEVGAERRGKRGAHVPRERLIAFRREERDERLIRPIWIHLQHVGRMGDSLERTTC